MIYGPLKVTKLNWLYFDLDSYFATIEQHLDPNLRHKPIAIVPLMSDSTCAIAASFEAKQMGVKTGTKIYEAKRLCPELICVQARPSIYTKYHRLIFAEINKYLCIDHIFSIDEGACKLTGDQSQEEVVLLLAKKIKEGIRKNIGQYITCSIGIAPNRYLAKIATSIQKPNGITVIKPEDITNKLFPLKLRTLPGIGSATFKKLGLAGIDSIQKLYQLNPTQLEAIWGSIHGKKCWYLLRGVDLPVEATKKATIGQSKVIGPDSRDEKLARNVAQQLILKAASRLRGKNLYTSRITLYPTFRTKTLNKCI
jgi:DNA polymerase IV